MAPATGLYSRQASASLPGNKNNLSTLYTANEEDDVELDDAVRVGMAGTSPIYLIHQQKIRNNNITDYLEIKINLQSTLAPLSSPIYLQVWNMNSSVWETIASDTSGGEDTDFDLRATISSNLSNYYDTANENEIALRVYQLTLLQ